MKSSSALESFSGLWRPILVTAAAFVCSILLFYIPMPGLQKVDHYMTGLTSISIAALGIWPWLTALCWFEIAALAFPKLHSPKWITEGHAHPFGFPIMAAALAIAAFQAYGIVVALIEQDLHSANSFLVTTSVLTIVGGLAAQMALAHWISRAGLGLGFWVLLCGLNLSFVPEQVGDGLLLVSQGQYSYKQATVGALLVLIPAILTCCVFAVRKHNTRDAVTPLLWPALLSSNVVTTLITAALSLASPELENNLRENYWLLETFPVILVTALFVWFYFDNSEPTLIRVISMISMIVSVALVQLQFLVTFNGLGPNVFTLTLVALFASRWFEKSRDAEGITNPRLRRSS